MEMCTKEVQMRSERELRRVAQHIATLLPEDMGDAKRVCDLGQARQGAGIEHECRSVGAIEDDRGEIAHGFLVQHARPDQDRITAFQARNKELRCHRADAALGRFRQCDHERLRHG